MVQTLVTQLSTPNLIKYEGNENAILNNSAEILTNYSSDKNPADSDNCHGSIDLLSTEQDVSGINEETKNEETKNKESKLLTVDVTHFIIHKSKLSSLEKRASE